MDYRANILYSVPDVLLKGKPRMADKSSLLCTRLLLAALAGVLALPFFLRPRHSETVDPAHADLPARRLVLISPHWEGVRAEFGRAFSHWTAERFGHRSELEWLDLGGTADAIRYVKSEFTRSPDGIEVDLFFGGGVDPFMQLSDLGLLAATTLPPHVLEPIPRTFAGIEMYDADGRWFGAALAGFGILYNHKVCERLNLPEPRAWHDLGRSVYRSWIGSGDPRSSGSVHMAYEIILQAYGWDEGWGHVIRLSGNTRNFSRGGNDTPKDVAMGEVACGMVIDVYAWRQIAEVGPERMSFVLPEGLTVMNPDGIAVLKGAPHPELAARFIEFVLTEPGQKLWCLKVGTEGGPREFELCRMPVLPGLAARYGEAAAVTYDPYQWKGGFTYDPHKGSRRWVILNDLLGATVIDTHRELVAAWTRVKDLPPEDPRVAALVRPPLSEAELLELAAEPWSDPERRARMRAQWTREAQERYRQIGGTSW